ncbi:MAG TPA: hypothetical protein EYO58_07210, partial [Flavobacteriales bacterium]|nr:hypothetical protein [Flavobacteriales bacterium]
MILTLHGKQAIVHLADSNDPLKAETALVEGGEYTVLLEDYSEKKIIKIILCVILDILLDILTEEDTDSELVLNKENIQERAERVKEEYALGTAMLSEHQIDQIQTKVKSLFREERYSCRL